MLNQGFIEPSIAQRSWTPVATCSCAGWDANRRHNRDLPTKLRKQIGRTKQKPQNKATVRIKTSYSPNAIVHEPIMLHAMGQRPHFRSHLGGGTSGKESEASICERNLWTIPVGIILRSPNAPETDGTRENHIGTKAQPSPDVGVMHSAKSALGTGVIDAGVAPLECPQLRLGVLHPVPVLATDIDDVH